MIDQNRIERLVNQWNEGSDRFLVEVRSSPSRVAVFIDKPSGVTLEECAALSKHLSVTLEPEGVWEHCELEVSSPGMDQPLRVVQQYLRRIGREVRVVTRDGREHNGILEGADEDGIDLLEVITEKENNKRVRKEQMSRIPHQNIKETKLKLSFKI